MKTELKYGLGALIIIGLISAFFLLGGGSASVISTVTGNDMPKTIETPYSCQVADTCEQSIINGKTGTQEELDYAKQFYDIVCLNNLCTGVLK